MGNLIAILLTLVLLVCNLVYCGRRMIEDGRHSRRAEVTWGLFAFCGALLALALMSWATFNALGQF